MSERETKLTVGFSNDQIELYESDPEMIKVFKKFIRTYHVNIGSLHEDFEYWRESHRKIDPEKCLKCRVTDEPNKLYGYSNHKTIKYCPECLKHLKEEAKDRE